MSTKRTDKLFTSYCSIYFVFIALKLTKLHKLKTKFRKIFQFNKLSFCEQKNRCICKEN